MPNENIGGISVSIAVGLQELEAQLQQAQQMSQQAGQAMAQAFNGASTAATGLSSSLVEVGSSLTPLLGLGLALAPISAGIIEAGKSALEAAGKFEQWQVSFTQLLGSATAAKSMLEDLVNFATRTPFEIPDVVSNAQRLMAFGFAARDVIPILTSLGDAVSGLGRGAQSLNSLVLAFGEMEAKGVVNLRQLNMLTNQGIPAIELLAKAYGVSITEMSDAITKKLVPSAEAIPVLLAGITEKFGGMMDKQSQTFLGMLSNLSDAAMKTFAAIGNTMLPVAKDMEQAGFSILNSLTGIARSFESLPVPVQEAAIALAAVGAAAAPVALALGAVGLAITSIGAAMPVLLPLAGILGGIAAGVALIHFADVDTEALHFFQTLHDGFSGLRDLVSGVTDTVRSFSREIALLSNLIPGLTLVVEAWKEFGASIHTVKDAILVLMPPLDAARVAFSTLAIATEYLSGNYKSMDAASKAVHDSLMTQLKPTVDATSASTALGGAIGGVTDHLVLGTKAHADHAGAVSSTATAYKNWNDQVSAALGLGPGNIKITSDLGAAFKYLGDQVAAADELWKHYIVDAGQALGIMEKGTGTVGGFTVSMENGVEMIKGSKEALQSTSGTVLDFSHAEEGATSVVNQLTGGLGSQSSAFSELGVTSHAASRHVREALTGMEDGFRATTGQVNAMSVGVAFLAMQLSGLTMFAGSGIDYSKGQSDLQHQLYLAKQAAGDPTAQPMSFTVATSGPLKGQQFGSLDELNQALQDLNKNAESAASATSKLASATQSTIASTMKYVDGVGNIYDSYQKMIDAINKNPDLGGLWHTIDTAATAATSLTQATQATTAAQQTFVDGLGNVYSSYAALVDAINKNPLLAGPATSQGENLISHSSTMSSTMAEAIAQMTKQATPVFSPGALTEFEPGGGGGKSGTSYTYNGQPVSEAMYRAMTQFTPNMPPGSTAQLGSAISSGMSVGGNPTWNTGTVASNQQGGVNGQGIQINLHYPSFNSQQQADQIMKQVVTQLRTVVGIKI